MEYHEEIQLDTGYLIPPRPRCNFGRLPSAGLVERPIDDDPSFEKGLLLDDTRFWSGIERDFAGFAGAARTESDAFPRACGLGPKKLAIASSV